VAQLPQNKGGRGALAAGAQRWWPERCWRPGGEDRWGWRLEGDSEEMNRFKEFGEEGAYRMELLMAARMGGGAPPTVGRRGGGGRRLGCRGASWS
jgi:hypothetical protein